MTWIVPEFSRSQVDKAGQALASPRSSELERLSALEVLSNWRASHSFPLNTFQIGLRRNAKAAYEHALVAQRLKRVPSIVAKLRRMSGMQLSRMQDIGGCRAVVDSVAHVRRVRSAYASSQMRHTLTSEKDYIDRPKASGYRGIHLVYKYLSDRSETHNGLLVEIQLRSRIQHAWATAVEIVGTFLDQSLKASEGSAEWLRFFELTGSVFAHVEGTAAVEGHPSRDELVATVREMRNRLRVNEVLHSYGTALTHAGQTVFPNAHYFILNLKPVTGQLEISEFSRHQLTTATNFYLALEKTIDPASAQQVVLVSADSFASLRRLYPNYFLDTTLFSRTLTEALA